MKKRNTKKESLYVVDKSPLISLFLSKNATGLTAGNMKNLGREKITSNINNLIFLHYE